MDLPPPPPPPPLPPSLPPLFRHQPKHSHHLRYGNVLHPTDFTPIPYGTHLPPPHLRHPPPLSPPRLPPPYPGRYIAQLPLSPPLDFSPPCRPIPGRADLYEFDRPPEPYFNRNDYLEPPPLPMPPRENIPLRFLGDHPERNPFRAEVLDRGCGDLRENFHWGAMERRSRVLDIGDHERYGYRDGFYQSREMWDRRVDDERRWDDGMNDWGRRWDCGAGDLSHALYSERNYDERRWHDRDSDGGRWNNGITDWGRVQGNERVYDERNWIGDVIDRDYAIWTVRDYGERRWNNEISDRANELYSRANVDQSRLRYFDRDLDPFKLENGQLEWSEDDLGLGRVSGRLDRVVSYKKRRLQKKNASHGTQPGNCCSWHSRGCKCQNFSKRSNDLSFRSKEGEGSEQLEMRTEDKGVKEQSPVDLALSFKSNALIGKAIMAPPSPADEADCNLLSVSDGKVDSMPGPSFSKSNEAMVEEDHLTCEFDVLSDPLLVSKEFQDTVVASVSRTAPAYDSNDLNDKPVKNEDLKGNKLQYPDGTVSGRTQVTPIRKTRSSGKQLMGENNLQEDEKAFGASMNSNNCGGDQYTFPCLNSDTVLRYSAAGIVSKRDDIASGSGKPSVSNLKRKRSSFTTLSASSCAADDLVTESSSHAESFNIKDAYCVCKLTTDGFACHKGGICHGDDMGSDHAKNVDNLVQCRSASLDAENEAIQYSGLCSYRVDDNCETSCEDGFATSENDLVRGPSEVQVFCEGQGMVDSASIPEISFGPDSSFHGPRLKFYLSDGDVVADGFVSDCSRPGWESTRSTEQKAEQIQGALSASVASDKYCLMNVEGKDGSGNLNDTGSDETLADGNKLQVSDELVTIANNLSSYGHGFCASTSGDELLASGFGMQSCISSPKDISSGFSKDSGPMRAAPNTVSLGKTLGKASSDNSPTNTESPAPLPEGGEVAEKLNISHGKLISSKSQLTSATPRIFPGIKPGISGNSRMFNSAHVTKSRTWHRTGNSTSACTKPKVKPAPLPQSHGTKNTRTIPSSYVRKGNSLVRKASPPSVTMPGLHASSSSVYRRIPYTMNFRNTQAANSKIGDGDAPTQLRIESVNMCVTPDELPLKHNCQLNCAGCNLEESLPDRNVPRNYSCEPLDSLETIERSYVVTDCQTGPANSSDSSSTPEEENSRKKITYVKRRSNQLVASSSSDEISKLGVDKSQAPSSSDGYFKSKKYQLVRASSEDHDRQGDANVNSRSLNSRAILTRTSTRRQCGFAKGYSSSKLSLVWKLHDTLPSEKRKKLLGPRKVWPQLFPWKKTTQWRSFMHALGTKLSGSSFSTVSQKLLLSRKRGAIYKRSTHGYSLRMSKVLSVGGASLKWSKSIDRNSKMASEEATRAVAAAEKRKKEESGAVPAASKNRNNVSRKLVLNDKLRPGERIFRIGSERYKMDPTRRTLLRITDAETESSSVTVQSAKNSKRPYVPKRLLIGNEEYVRIGNGNKLVRDPKKRTRVLASEKVRWSLRTARLRMARKRKYCQFFTRFGKCNKDDGKCPYIHDTSKIVVCTKFLNGSCSNADCKLTHKIMPERMQDCSYFLKGSCSNENCPYRHVNVNPDSAVCESFRRGYCADGNECPKKHTYVCPVYEATGTCPQASKCKLHHPKKKPDKKPTNEQKIVRGRYFDGGLVPECSIATTEELGNKGTDDMDWHEGKFPDYISLDVSDDDRMDHITVSSM